MKTRQIEKLKKVFNDKNTPFYTITEEIKNMLLQAKLETKIIAKSSSLTGLFLYNISVNHKARYIVPYS